MSNMNFEYLTEGTEIDLSSVANIITRLSYKRVVLQFSDEYLPSCSRIYDLLSSKISSDVDIYITADSSFGSSIDDISAMHVDSDLLIYIGHDLSASAGIPVCILPPRKCLDIKIVCANLCTSLSDNIVETNSPIALLADASYVHLMNDIAAQLTGYNIICGILPPTARLDAWSPHAPLPEGCESLNGLYVPSEIINNAATTVIYIGDSASQLQNILLRMSANTILSCSFAAEVTVLRGETSRCYRERYVGVLRVKEAQVIGLIVGSMGVAGELTRQILHRLHRLIEASGKKYYTFVMGRINEAKLCNFPEVDIFCLLSNEDSAVISPKTFPTPVVTPFELELGLGARDWTCTYLTSSYHNEEEMPQLLYNVMKNREEDPIDSSDDEREEVLTGANTAIALRMNESQLTTFQSPAADFLNAREYTGLVPNAPEGHSIEVQQGMFGIASDYDRNKNDTSK